MRSVEVVATESEALTAEPLAYAGLAFASVGWASAFIAGKVVLAEMTPLAAATWRYLLAMGILAPFALRRQRRPGLRGVLVPLTVMVVCGGILYPWLFLLALKYTSATNTSLLIALNPMLTVLLAPLVGEGVPRRRLAGVALALVGAATVVTKGEWRDLGDLAAHRGDLIAMAAASAWAAFNLASRGAVKRISPALTNSIVYGAGAIALGLLARGEHPWTQLSAASPAALASLLVMVLMSSVLAGQLFLVGVRVLGVSRAVAFIYLVPVVTAVLSLLVLDERLQPVQIIGGAAVLAGVYWSART